MTEGVKPVSRIAISGPRSDVRIVAAVLLNQLQGSVQVTLVEEPEGAGPPAPAIVPCSHPYFRLAGISEDTLREAETASFSLGFMHRGWLGDDHAFYDSPSGSLPTINGTALHHIMLRAAMQHGDTGQMAHLMAPFRLAEQAQRAGKFGWPSRNLTSPAALLGPMACFSRGDLADLAFNRMPNSLVAIHSGTPLPPVREADGDITSLKLDTGVTIEADFYINLSADLLPVNDASLLSLPFGQVVRAFVEGAEANVQTSPMAQAMPDGVLLTTPVVGGKIVELLCRAGVPTGQVSRLGGPTAQAEDIRLHQVENCWRGNVAHLGAASGQLGPYLASDTLLLLEQTVQLAQLLPAACRMDSEAAEFNARNRRIFEQLAARIAAPFALNQRSEPIWNDARRMQLPDMLKTRITQFKSRGRLPVFEGELFDAQTWVNLLIGFGVVPERVDPKALAFDMPRLLPVLKKLAGDFAQTVNNLPAR